ncbi:hypothetical protein [Brevundimonas guildfordensis]|uniref:DUF429 domain-containing protein n=1 Tax=Brevundimonas guildfordensis TaxID=2762241 RepID=A0ABR8R2Z0_9CAUL|nr:hypothetical protein [Brevundimonas guildfordensis]MBD7942146.1 hypothetical protein [Brevundimonas guildfordensis]
MNYGRADIAIGVIDVGSPKGGKWGWAILATNAAPVLGKDLDVFIDAMTALGARWPLAIGFEAPLFIPTPAVALKILSARKGEGSRPWSAGAGAAVTTAALAVVTYTLAGLRRGLSQAMASTDFSVLPVRPGDTLFFEAFVTAAAKGDDHADDAFIAARETQALLRGGRPYRSAIDEPEVFSVLGASLLRTEWSTDLAVLSAPCLVVKPGFDHYA